MGSRREGSREQESGTSLCLLDPVSPPRPGRERRVSDGSQRSGARQSCTAPGQPPQRCSSQACAATTVRLPQLLTSATRGNPKIMRHDSPDNFKLQNSAKANRACPVQGARCQRTALLPTSRSQQPPAGRMRVPGAGAPVQLWAESLVICRLSPCFGQFARPLSACQKDKCLFPPGRRAANETHSEGHRRYSTGVRRAAAPRLPQKQVRPQQPSSGHRQQPGRGSRGTGCCTGRGWQLLCTPEPKCPSFGWHDPAPGAILGCAAPV